MGEFILKNGTWIVVIGFILLVMSGIFLSYFTEKEKSKQKF